MIHIQKVWQKKTYERLCEGMHEFSYACKIKTKEVKKFSDIALLNPIILARNCTPSSENVILEIMIKISENPMAGLCSGITLTATFPTERGKVIYEKHDIDKLFLPLLNEDAVPV